MEVMADDGLRGKPDYEDCEAITALLREQKTFPVTLELSDAQAQQAAITVENLRDWSVENVADFAAMTAHLKAQGYPR
jgi:hypothetical protein